MADATEPKRCIAKRCTATHCKAWVCRKDSLREFCVGHLWSKAGVIRR